MAKLGFGERYRTDQRFQRAVENLQREAVFRLLGLDPEKVARAWDGEVLNLAPSDLQVGAGVPASSEDPTPGVSPVAEMDAKAAVVRLEEAAKARDVSFLRAVFASDARIGPAMAAARALFDLRTGE